MSNSWWDRFYYFWKVELDSKWRQDFNTGYLKELKPLSDKCWVSGNKSVRVPLQSGHPGGRVSEDEGRGQATTSSPLHQEPANARLNSHSPRGPHLTSVFEHSWIPGAGRVISPATHTASSRPEASRRGSWAALATEETERLIRHNWAPVSDNRGNSGALSLDRSLSEQGRSNGARIFQCQGWKSTPKFQVWVCPTITHQKKKKFF